MLQVDDFIEPNAIYFRKLTEEELSEDGNCGQFPFGLFGSDGNRLDFSPNREAAIGLSILNKGILYSVH